MQSYLLTFRMINLRAAGLLFYHATGLYGDTRLVNKFSVALGALM
jgi:hypothetical protein